MKTEILLTVEDAINVAKMNCIREFEMCNGTVNDNAFLNSSAWLIRQDRSTRCQCGETLAVEVLLFPSELPEGFHIKDKEAIFSSTVGVCDYCGQE